MIHASGESTSGDHTLSDAEFAALMAPLGPFPPAPRLAVAVSGGPHSLALALLARDWAAARGGDILAIIAEHGLRAESAAEAGHVAALLAGQGIAARILPLGLPPGPAMQERARDGRMAALLKACAEASRPWLLLGHHRLDQAETLLFRAARGSGAEGLAAMAPVRAMPQALLLRPLLGVPPARLEALLAARGVAPVRDPSNDNPRFARIRLRQALADPGGEGKGVAALAEAAEAFAARRARAEQALAERLARAARLYPTGWAEIDPAALGRDRVAEHALGRLVRLIGGGLYAPGRAEVAALLARGQGTLAGAWLRGGPRWRLQREPSGLGAAVPARQGARWDGRFLLTGPGAEGHEIAALGAAFPSRPPLPVTILRTLPAIYAHGSLVAVPSLLYPGAEACAPFALAFAPQAGAATGQEAGGKNMGGHFGGAHSRIGGATLS